MRRIPTLLVLAALASLSIESAATLHAGPPDVPDVSEFLVVRVEQAPAEVRLSGPAIRKRWPEWPGWLTIEDDDERIAAVNDRVTFVAVRPGLLQLTQVESSEPSTPRRPRAVDSTKQGIERFVWAGSSAFGSVASADPTVYDHADLPLWFAAKLAPRQSVTSRLEAPLPALRSADATAKLRLRAVATHTGPISIGATWGAKGLGTITRDSGAGGAVFEWTIPAATWGLLGDERKITFIDTTAEVVVPGDPNDTSDDVGTLWLSSVEIDAPTAEHAGRFVEVEPGVFQALAQVGDEALVAWDAPVAPDVKDADEIIVAVPPLVAGAQRLAAHRSAHGIRAVVVSTESLAPPGDGPGLASAIERLVATPRTHGTGPRYLLLVGDADRDRGTKDTIPARYARTVYNGATATDRPYGAATKDGGPGAIVGRLPFSDPWLLEGYVNRVIRVETKPPADDSRRTLRFITSEGRFGPAIDGMIERLFANVVATHIPTSYDVDVTFARAGSEYGWPAGEFNEKVIDGLNAGSLFFTYVGHGWWNGFDDLRVEGRRYPILKSDHVPRVAVRGTPPAMFVIACTTALYDDEKIRSIGESLLDRPEGPLAYWGATRVCHPAWNSIVGRQMAMEMFKDPERRLGAIIDAAVKASVARPVDGDALGRFIESAASSMLKGARVDLERLKDEGASMYVLLGDPALRLPFPKEDLKVAAVRAVDAVEVTVTGAIPDGTLVVAALEVPRTEILPLERDPKATPEEAMRRRHDRSNDKALARGSAAAKGGTVTVRLAVPADHHDAVLYAQAHAVFLDDVHQGWVAVPAPGAGK